MSDTDLAAALAAAAESVASSSAPEPTHPENEDWFIVALAQRWGEDPAAVLKEFHGNTALARLCRKLLGVSMDNPFTKDEQTHLLCLQLQAGGLRGERLYEEAARRINERQNAAGERERNVAVASIKPMANRGRKSLVRKMGMSALFL